MKTYYCHDCSRTLGHITGIETDSINLTGSQYLFEKYEKHTQIPSGSGFISIYDDPTYENYKGYTVSGSLSGALEIDEQNRKNLIWYAGENIGVTYQDGNIFFSNDTVKVVLPENTGKLHSFPVDAQNYTNAVCANCGNHIII